MTQLANSVALVTGATGFIGAALVRRLVAEGVRVHVLMREFSDAWRLEGVQEQLTVWRGDVDNFDAVVRCMHGVMPEVIFHLAGDTAARGGGDGLANYERAVATNFLGVVNTLAAARSCVGGRLRLFVRAGGLAEYGACSEPMRESQRERPLTAYAASQTAATHWLQMAQSQVPFAIATLRLGLTYGAQQSSDFFVPAAIDTLLQGKVFEVRAGERGRDYVFVEDVVDAFTASAAREDVRLRGAVINIASGDNVMLKDVAVQIAANIGRPDLLKAAPASGAGGEIETMKADIAKAERLLGWKPATRLCDGLSLTIAERRKALGRGA